MAEPGGLRRVFANPNFDVKRFVRNNQSNDAMVDFLSNLSEEASSKMKQAIFENYKLFIKAGKAASELDAAMHQIHRDFTEKRRVMNALTETCLFNEVIPGLGEEESAPKLAGPLPALGKKLSEFADAPVKMLVDVVEEIAQLTDDATRRVIFDGEVNELSVDTYSFICVARLFLLNDVLVVAYTQSGRVATCRYRVQTVYPLDTVSVVALPPHDRWQRSTDAFKVTANMGTRVFQSPEQQTWVRVLEEAKHTYVASLGDQTRRDSGLVHPGVGESDSLSMGDSSAAQPSSGTGAPRGTFKMPVYAIPPSAASVESLRETIKALNSTLPECSDLLTLPADLPSPTPSRKNPFGDQSQSQPSPSVASTPKHPMAWLWDVPEDLDVAISERDFVRATELAVKAREQIDLLLATTDPNENSAMNSDTLDEILDSKPRSDWLTLSQKIYKNEVSLSEALQYELITAADRHSAPRSISAPVSQLVSLGKATLAAQLFLAYRSNLMARTLTRGVRQEGNQLVYLNRLSFAFHRGVVETDAQWRSAVVKPLMERTLKMAGTSGNQERISMNLLSARFCSWVLEEADKFSQQLRVILVDSRSITFHSMALAAHRMIAHAERVTELVGVDIRSLLQANLSRTWRSAAEAQAHVLRDAVKHRAKQENWEPVTTKSISDQEQYTKELYDLGLLNRNSTGTSLPLTVGTCQFVRSLYYFVRSAIRLHTDELIAPFSQCIANIIRAELENYEVVLQDTELGTRKPFVLMNLEFIAQQAIPKLVKPLNCLQYQAVQEVIEGLNRLLERSR
ncbi:Exocyst complex component 8 [Clonorchis sinensis]|uniref:Exocyst complex component 8 n=1 Tax=Clonorchis sinensis TaxID=79923 RepID=A0A419QDK9_CLOSI|nr:Exocyst complex component 8 [Clonorchis sinensis]